MVMSTRQAASVTTEIRPPRVSVISIFYNAAPYFAEAIDSVLGQDFENFEMLLVDDGSTDSSTSIAHDYEKRDRRVRYLEHAGHANRGMSATRNLGIREARGDLVAFIDADDRWRPSKLSEQVALLDRLPDVDAVCGSVNYWASHEGGRDRLLKTGHTQDRPIDRGEASLQFYPLGRANAPSMSDLMFRRQSIVDAGGFEERFTGAYEDQAFLAKFYLRSVLYVSTKTWSDYRLHPHSCMAEVKRAGTYDDTRRMFLEWFEAHLANSRFRDDPSLNRALKRAMGPYATVGPATLRVRKALAGTFVRSIVRASRARLQRLRPLLAPGPAILMYHRVANESFDPWGLAVSPTNFAAQIEWIAQNRTVLPLAEFADLHRDGRLPRNAIALTFDDGYACNAKVAAPLLERLGIPATIFLPAELIERGDEFWWDELERIVMECKANVLKLADHEIALGEPNPQDRDWPFNELPRTDRQSAYKRLWSLLYPMPASDLDAAIMQLRSQARIPKRPRPSHRPMAPDEIRSLRSSPVTFGSHARSHTSLPSLSLEEQASEIAAGTKQCAELIGARPCAFAYPYGDSGPETEALVEAAGYAFAVRADGRFVSRRSRRFALPRLFVGDWDQTELAWQLGRP